jgi:hypothetical protein
MSRIILTLKALRQLGPRQLGLYGIYRLGLASGHYRRITAHPPPDCAAPGAMRAILPLPGRQALAERLGEAGCRRLLAEADEIVAGRVRLFGGEPVALELIPSAPMRHWTEYSRPCS